MTLFLIFELLKQISKISELYKKSTAPTFPYTLIQFFLCALILCIFQITNILVFKSFSGYAWGLIYLFFPIVMQFYHFTRPDRMIKSMEPDIFKLLKKGSMNLRDIAEYFDQSQADIENILSKITSSVDSMIDFKDGKYFIKQPN